MPSKFGGVPVEDQGGSKFGGVPIDQPQPPATPPATDEHSLSGFGSNLLSSAGKFLGGAGSALVHTLDPTSGNTIYKLGRLGVGAFEKPVRSGLQMIEGKDIPVTPEEEDINAIGRQYKERYGGLKNIGETLYHDPVGAAADVAMLAGAGGAALPGRAGRIASAVSEATNPVGLVTKPLGAAIKAAGPPLAESALGIRGQTHAFGATPGKAILEETSGVRPGTIAESARGKLGELGQELESKAATSKTPASLAPARQVVAKAIGKAESANSEATPRELAPMERQLTKPAPGFGGAIDQPPAPLVETKSPILDEFGRPVVKTERGELPPAKVAEQQSPLDLLHMKRQFDQDFIRNWNPAAQTRGALGVGRQVHHALGTEFERAVPGSEQLNQRISSLIPVAERAKLTDLAAGPGERILNRIARPTGGLFPLLFGLHEGGIPGALLTMAGQEGLTSPAVRMIGARTAYGLGRSLGSPNLRQPLLVGGRLQENQ